MDFDGHGPLVMVDDSPTDLFIAKNCFTRSALKRNFVTLDSGEA
jgi:hypothetical protein